MMLRIDIHLWFAMVAILNPKWPSKYKNPPTWAKFGFEAKFCPNWRIFVFGGHFVPWLPRQWPPF
jgi:hypothetical protein